MRGLIIFGNGSTARLMAYHALRENIPLVAFTVDKKYITSEYLNGLPVLPFEDIEEAFPPEQHQVLVAVGPAQMNQLRADRCMEAERKRYPLFS